MLTGTNFSTNSSTYIGLQLVSLGWLCDRWIKHPSIHPLIVKHIADVYEQLIATWNKQLTVNKNINYKTERKYNTTARHNLTSTSVFWDGRISTDADPTSTHRANLIGTRRTVRLPTINFSSGWVADSSDFGLLGEQSSPRWEIPCPWPHEPPCNIWCH